MRISLVLLSFEIFFLFSSSSSLDSLETYSPSRSYLGPLFPLKFFEDVLNLNAVNIYRENLPIPHIFIDNFFPQDLLHDVVQEFPSNSGRYDPTTSPSWIQSEINCQFRKLEISSHNLGPATSYVISQLQSSPFLRFLEILTGIDSLIPDPHLYGAGPHQTLSGGYLSIHLDYNYNEKLQMWRRVNVFIYLNEDWEEDWGGHLELWDANMTHKVTSIAPFFNRLVVFTATEISWHGHPEPLNCPASRSRRSIALYYYTAIDGFDREKRQTEFRPRENDDWRVGEQYLSRHHNDEL
jgi:Rps23 Pro-64 3,4-dihydroxylase Tpa1-like proline 4-hydroxylase